MCKKTFFPLSLSVFFVLAFVGTSMGAAVLDVDEEPNDYYTITAHKSGDPNTEYWELKVDVQSGGIFNFQDLTDDGDGQGGHTSYTDTTAYNRQTTLIRFDGRGGHVFSRKNSVTDLADKLTFTEGQNGSSFTIEYEETSQTSGYYHGSYSDGERSLSPGDLLSTLTIVIKPPDANGTFWDWTAEYENVCAHDLSAKIWAADYKELWLWDDVDASTSSETSMTDGAWDPCDPESYTRWTVDSDSSLGLTTGRKFTFDSQSGLAGHDYGGGSGTGSWAGHDYIRYGAGYDIDAADALEPNEVRTDSGQIIIDIVGEAADTTAPSPDPMTWATDPYATGATSISMTATTATDTSGVEYYFECTAGGGNSSGWQDSTTYEDTGLSELTEYTYRVKARDKSGNQNETAYSTTKSATTEDSTAPSPDPMTWATEPYAISPSAVSMTATTATDASGVEYYFECAAGGGNSSGWQDSTTYTDTGLSELTQYSYRVKARDKSGNQNEAAYSTAKSATTQDGTAPSPDPMTWATEPYATGASSISMTTTTATDASGVEYYFECTAGGGNNSGWQSSATYEDTGLSEFTQYSYRVKARDTSSNYNETAYSTTKSATTEDSTAPTPDPMTWATQPYATGVSSISMTATTATDASGVEYYFECTAGGGNSSGWQDSATYEDTGLDDLTEYTYRVKARDKSSNQNETAYSTTKSATTQDGTAPSPDPMTWATEPYAVTGGQSVSMTTTTATDASGVEYYFECTAGGGNNSIWQDSATYTDTGLIEQRQYSYRVKSRDKSSNQNETSYSTTKSATTSADTTAPSPDPMQWDTGPYAAGMTSISMTATIAGDPCGVEYYFDETSGNPGGSDSGWQDATTYTDTGLNYGTTYTYRVKSRDKSSNQNETAWSTSLSAMTETVEEGPEPVGWWKLDETSGTIAYDSAGDNDGNVVGAAWVSGHDGNALTFDEVNDYVKIPDFAYADSNEFSISFWFKVDDVAGTLYQYMFSHNDYNEDSSINVYFRESSESGNPEKVRTIVQLADSTNWTYDTPASLADGQWHMYAITVSSTDGGRIYIDGNSVGIDPDLRGSPFNPDTDIYLGARCDLNNNRFYGNSSTDDGLLDDVRIYSQALTEEEIGYLYSGAITEATNPSPADDANNVSINAVLSWTPGAYAASHDVYLGTDYNSVANASPESAEYMGNFDTNSYDPNGLQYGTTYYWAVDEVNGVDIWVGYVWSFATEAAPDTTAPSPAPMTWATEPYATGGSSISMTATTATDASGVEYYFECTAGGGNSSSWQDSATYQDTGLDDLTQYTYRVKARDKSSNQNETAYSTTKSATTQDGTAPSPDPMTWATEPYATGTTSISMTATTATDSSGVEYYFDCTSAGGHDSGWQDGATYEDTSLSPSTQYSYQVKARDKSSNQNETTYSTLKSATTDSDSNAPTLVGWWKLDDGSGTTAGDSAGNNDANIVGASWVSGQDGNALTFDEVDDYVQIPDFAYTNQSNEFSLSFWFKIDDVAGTLYQYMFSHNNYNVDNSLNVYFRESSEAENPEKVRTVIQLADSTNWSYDTPASLADGQWHMYTITVSSTDGGKIYIDANSVGSDPNLKGASFNPTTDIYLGGRCDLNANRFYGNSSTSDGLLDDIRIYDCVLSSSQVQELYGGEDTSAPSPDPMTWATEPYATGASSISMTATTATDSSGVQYYFDCTTAGGHDSGWQSSATYEDTGLAELTQYSYRVKARDLSSNNNETAYSTVKSATTQDGTAPSPNPMTWATDPYATGTTSISMTATTATDASGVEYYFDCTTAGGHDSGWQDSTTYEDTGLSASTQYSYQVKARDKSSNQNETTYSTLKSATTDATPDTTPPSPDPMTWATEPYATGTSSVLMTATTATDVSGVEYYFECTAGGGNSSGWQDSTTYTDTGLSELTTYTYRVKARDKSGNQNETAYSTTKSATTQDGTVPSPDPVTWATDPYGVSTSSISMTATTATDASGVEYYFECTAGGGNDSGWQDSATYTDTGLTEAAQYSYRVKARDKSSNQNETAYSVAKSASTLDATAPSPDPMTWATDPYAVGATSISMTATTATDTSGVEYYFECTAGGGDSSGWQDSATYVDVGLTPSTTYTYRVKARDKSSNQNQTAYSTTRSATTSSMPTEPNLVGWWRFDETSGTTAYDSADSNDGTVYGGAAWVSGTSNNALTFDEVDDYVQIPDFNYTNTSDEFSVCFWFKIDDVAGTLWQYMFSHNNYSVNNSLNVYFRESSEAENPEKVRTIIRLNDGTNWSYDTPASLADGQWHMYAITVSSTDGGKIYIDGSSVGSDPNLKGASFNPSTDIYIGARCDLNANRFYGNPSTDDGLIDDVRIYEEPLSADAVSLLYVGNFTYATQPSPADGAEAVDVNSVLSWKPGYKAASHDVYLGTDYNAVADANHSSSEYMGNVGPNSYDPNTLSYNTTYYWAVDEVNDPNLWDGDVWSFTTEYESGWPGKATNPSPANGATNVNDVNVDISWTAGTDATSHDVYFGTDSTPDAGEFKGNQGGTTYDPGTLTKGTTYYWQIDEKNALGTNTGDVWSFTIVANQNPIANAGSNQIVTDSDENGSETVTLDASASFDPDGSISSYVWTEDGSQIATGVGPNVSFNVGSHTVLLTVTDNESATDMDTVVITVTSPGGGTTYYVDFDSGNDNNNGTSTSTPWKRCPCDNNATGTAAATTLQAGDTVIFKGGVSYEGELSMQSSGTSGSPIIIDGDTAQTWGSGKAIIDGSQPLTGWSPCASAADCGGAANWANMYKTTLPGGIDKDAWQVNLFDGDTLLAVAQGPTAPDPFFYDKTSSYNSVPVSAATSTSIVDSSFFTQSSSSAWDGAYAHVWATGNQVYTSKVTSFNPSTDTIYFETLPNPPYSDRNTLYAMGNSVVVLDAAGEYVVNETTGAVYLWPHSGTSNITVSARMNGVNFNGKSYITLQGFKIIKFSAGFDLWGNGAGIKNTTSGASNLMIRNNEVAYNRAMSKFAGVDIRGGVSNVTIENNYIHENLRSRGLLTGGSNITIKNNTLQKNGGTGIYLSGCQNSDVIGNSVLDHSGVHGNGLTAYQGCSNILFFGNTVLRGNCALTTQDGDSITIAYNILHKYGGGYCVADWTWNGEHCTNLHYYNNVIMNDDPPALSTGGSGLIVKNNIIDGGNGGSYNIWTSLSWSQDPKYGWYPGTGEIIEQDKSKIFVDWQNQNFHLKSTSPAKDAGTNVGYDEDIEGNPVPSGSAVDIGAYEYQQ